MGKLAIAVFATLLLAGSAWALPETTANSPSAEYDQCMNGKTTNADWSECGGAEVARQETRLEAAWAKAYSCFSSKNDDPQEGQNKQQFLGAQRLWIKWKEVACGYYAAPGSGRESQVLSFPVCEAGIISQRAAWLEMFAKQESEGRAVRCD